MKQKKIIASVIIAVIILACIGIGGNLLNSDHEHSFGEWETQTPAACESPEIEVRRCSCGEEETREGDPATGHTFVSIAAESALETPMEYMVVTADDLNVTGTCECGATVRITEGIEVEGAALVLGENTITVRCGELTTTLTIQAEKLDITLSGIVSDDTYVASGKKGSENSGKKDMGTKSDLYRIYFRANISEILDTELFAANKDNAKVQLILSITGGSVTDKTSFTLKAYDPQLSETDAAFSKLTWNSVDSKEGSVGTYAKLHWSNGTELVSDGVGHNVAVENGRIVVTLAYSQIADFVDKDGNILFAFATNTEGLKVGSLENKDEAKRPVFQVILNDEHFHVFDREVAERKYLVSANCKEKAKYHTSCACGEAGTEIFEYGAVIAHTYGALVPKVERTCTEDGMRAHYRCTVCQKYFVEKDGKKVATSVESLKIPAGHNCGKLIAQKDATCTTDGLKAHYQCSRCKKYFVDVDGQRVETTKEALKIQAVGHTYSELIPRQEKTCTEDGMKAHYRCTVCQKYFVEKDGKKVAISEASLKISAGHSYGKLIAQKDATCTQDGLQAHYQCSVCKKYFIDVDGQKVETTKEALTIPAAGHTYSELIPRQEKTCTEDGMRAHYRCTVCWKYFVEKDGKKVATSEASLKIPAGHSYGKLIEQKDATCTEDGMKAHYRCSGCKKYFVDVDGEKVETTKEALTIPATGHTFSELVPRREKTCTEDGMKAHYRCTVCQKYFVEKDGKKVATSEESLKIPAGHDMTMMWDETHHWTECAAGCGTETEHEAHHGGTATETEKAKCETCGQPYGELKTGVTGSIVNDIDIDSARKIRRRICVSAL